MLVLDEHRGAHCAAASLGLATRYDLAQAFQGDVRLDAATLFAGPKLHVIAAARAARGEGAGGPLEREVWQRCNRNYDWILIDAAPEPSRFVDAAAGWVLVAAANSASLTAAYAQLKRIGAVRPRPAPYLLIEADSNDAARVVHDNLIRVARTHLGIELDCIGALDTKEAIRAGSRAQAHARIAEALARAVVIHAVGASGRALHRPDHGSSVPSSRGVSCDLFPPAVAGSH